MLRDGLVVVAAVDRMGKDGEEPLAETPEERWCP